MYEEGKGIFWLGSYGAGVTKLDTRTGKTTFYTIEDGLQSNTIHAISGDSSDDLWLLTSLGITRFNPSSLETDRFDFTDGLGGSPVGMAVAGLFQTGNPTFKSENGTIFFGSNNGLTVFHPDHVQMNQFKPPLAITDFKVSGKSHPLDGKAITLAHHQNFFDIEFVALSFFSSSKNQYAYKLEGLDKDWVYTGTQREARYTNVSPGKYIFRVKGSNNDGVWNEQGASMQVTILPPWWQTWWAYSLYGMLALGLLYGLRQYTVNRERWKHELKLQRIEAEKMHEIDHLKSRFFANISHEFRTPLTLILGPLEKFISRTPEESEDGPVYQMMQRSAHRLLHLINQLLDLSKLEAGSMKLETKPADIVNFLKAIGLSFTSLAERKLIQYQVQYPVEHPVVYFDADKLEKIITNLLSNAFKFTPAGGEITVTAQLNSADKRAIPASFSKAGSSTMVKMLQLKIQDNGAGITAEQQEKIFDRFYQTDTSHTGEQEGSGIGLSLVKELVELHEGEIAVESQPEKGSCFTVRLPLLVADYEQITVGEAVVDKGHSTTIPLINTAQDKAEATLTLSATDAPLVLIVEDNADIRQFIRQHLSPAYQVIEACDGAKGYSKAVETIPDLILSDVMMPMMDGVELCRKLKQDEKTAHVPVILLTAKASGEGKIEGLETGADDYIIKPFEASELLVRIKNLIDSRKKLREHYRGQITVEPKSITVTSVDEQFLQRVMQIMEAHMADAAFSVEALGLDVGMSRMQLHRKLKGLTDQSPGEFIRSFRLKRAAMLLTQNYGNISEVAFSVGFNEPAYFTKCFKEQFGQTPSEYLIRQDPTAKA